MFTIQGSVYAKAYLCVTQVRSESVYRCFHLPDEELYFVLSWVLLESRNRHRMLHWGRTFSSLRGFFCWRYNETTMRVPTCRRSRYPYTLKYLRCTTRPPSRVLKCNWPTSCTVLPSSIVNSISRRSYRCSCSTPSSWCRHSSNTSRRH